MMMPEYPSLFNAKVRINSVECMNWTIVLLEYTMPK
jgi:hypothetical protein